MGFLVTVPSHTLPGVRHGYVLTARHVIESQIEVEVQVPDPFTNGSLYPPVRVEDWRAPLPGADLALAPLPSPPGQKYRAARLEMAIATEHMRLGMPIYYIGVFEPLDRPLARSGTIGALEQAGIPHKGGYTHDAHLVDCRSYRGFSGSPCFAETAFVLLDRPPPVVTSEAERLASVTHRVSLCGMFTAHHSDEADAKGVVSRYGVGIMLPSNAIHAALITDELRRERLMWDEEITAAKKQEQPPLENAGMAQGTPDDDEFARFDDLTRKLVKVPKKEIDQKRKDA